MSSKCVEHLCFVSTKNGGEKERFELMFSKKDKLDGRRPQLIKKLVGRALDENWIKPYQLFGYLKKTKKLKVTDLLEYAYRNEE